MGRMERMGTDGTDGNGWERRERMERMAGDHNVFVMVVIEMVNIRLQ